MLPDERSRPVFERYLSDRDDRLRGAAAEGLARLKNPVDLNRIVSAFEQERKTSPRLSMSFAMVSLGRNDWSESSPLRYLVDTLNSSSYRGEAFPFLVELARDADIRQKLYGALTEGTKDERIWLSRVMARSGDQGTVHYLEAVSRDSDPEIAAEALKAMRNLQARL
jgi:hypothetical protein